MNLNNTAQRDADYRRSNTIRLIKNGLGYSAVYFFITALALLFMVPLLWMF
jgi:hypothetical protein